MKISRFCFLLSLIYFSFLADSSQAADSNIESLLKTIHNVGPKGKGNVAAAKAWQELSSAKVSKMPAIIAGLNGANPIAENYIRSAIEVIASKQLDAGGKLPKSDLEQMVLNQKLSSRPRRLAFHWLSKIDSTAKGRLIPKMLNDPSLEFRHDAVEQLMSEAKRQIGEGAALPLYKQAFAAARDIDQIKKCAKAMKELKQDVDMQKHLGFIATWKLIGPFDNRSGKGYEVAYPVESEIDFAAQYKGMKGKVTWKKPATTDDQYGEVDLNNLMGKIKGAIVYATTDFHSATDQEVYMRLGCTNGVKVWVNGEPVFQREVYHAGMEIDQYTAKVKLKAGANQILLKVCQNEQKEPWAQGWKFQIRLSDKLGAAIRSEK